jgi:hypothetical protein
MLLLRQHAAALQKQRLKRKVLASKPGFSAVAIVYFKKALLQGFFYAGLQMAFGTCFYQKIE